jgi:DNA-directed RNA polymerase sigma subunit (sigma70/sigma32)
MRAYSLFARFSWRCLTSCPGSSCVEVGRRIEDHLRSDEKVQTKVRELVTRRVSRDASLNTPIRNDGDSGEWQDWLVDDTPSQERAG